MKVNYNTRVRDVLKLLKDEGFIQSNRKGSTHMKFTKGEYVFTFTNHGRGRDVSPAQIKELNLILEKIKKDNQ